MLRREAEAVSAATVRLGGGLPAGRAYAKCAGRLRACA